MLGCFVGSAVRSVGAVQPVNATTTAIRKLSFSIEISKYFVSGIIAYPNASS